MIPRRSRVGGWPIAAAIAVVALVLYAVRYALLPFVFAAAIGFMVEPLVAAGHRRLGGPRWPVAALLCVLLYTAIIVPGYWIVTTALVNLEHIVAHGPDIVHNIILEAIGANGVDIFGRSFSADALTRGILDSARDLLGLQDIVPAAKLGITAILAFVLTMVLIPYFMVSGPRLAEGTLRLLPPERRTAVRDLLPGIVPVLRRYLVGIFVVVAYTTLVAWTGFQLLFRLPNASLLALTVGVLELIPVIGPICSASIVGLTALQQHSLEAAIVLVVFALVLRLSIDNLVGPLVLGRAARIPAVVVMFAFVCGGMLFGVVGLLLAVPVATCIKIILGHYYAEPIREDRPPR
ncbi:MAG TPA: AI-2E family transporter [Alphaproteobacteria bacterium]|nr:AI-2E family transporter [Alphaproteobacteria bacterium]